MTIGINVSGLIGERINDDKNREIGKITSFLIDSSGQVKEAFAQNGNGEFVTYPVEKLRVDENGMTLITDVNAGVEALSDKFPLMRKKRKILDRLMENNKIPSETYTSLSKWLDKAIEGMEKETQNLLNDIDKQVEDQQDFIKKVQLARTFLEIEHAMGNVKNEIYHQSLMSLLKEIRKASQTKVDLQEVKQKLTSIFIDEEEVLPEPEPENEPKVELETEPETQPKVELETEPETQPRLVRDPEISKDQSDMAPQPMRVRVTHE
jgi:hypothetical protein